MAESIFSRDPNSGMADIASDYTGGPNAPKSPEKRLLDMLARMRNNTSGSYVVHLHLSALRPSHRQPHFMRMVARSLDSLASQQDVQVLNFTNSDVVLLCRNTPIDDVDDAVFRVRALFNEDPLTQTDDGSAEDHFSAWFDLSQSTDFKDFEEKVSTLAQASEEVKNQQTDAMSTGRASKALGGAPLTPDMVAGLTQKLLEARIGDLVHRQPAVLVGGHEKSQQLAFREHYIAMMELRERIAPKVDLFSGHWLFQYISETIDARVLEVISRLDYTEMDCPLSVNLNVSTVMARPFQNFHAVVGEHTDMVIVEIQIIDIFADMEGFSYARDWLKERGYRVLIDGLNPLTLNFFDPSALDVDFIKIGWGPEVKGGIDHDQTQQIQKIVGKMPSGSVVLARVDSEEGVSWGLGLGITCFQGHFIDKVVEKMAQKGLLK